MAFQMEDEVRCPQCNRHLASVVEDIVKIKTNSHRINYHFKADHLGVTCKCDFVGIYKVELQEWTTTPSMVNIKWI